MQIAPAQHPIPHPSPQATTLSPATGVQNAASFANALDRAAAAKDNLQSFNAAGVLRGSRASTPNADRDAASEQRAQPTETLEQIAAAPNAPTLRNDSTRNSTNRDFMESWKSDPVHSSVVAPKDKQYSASGRQMPAIPTQTATQPLLDVDDFEVAKSERSAERKPFQTKSTDESQTAPSLILAHERQNINITIADASLSKHDVSKLRRLLNYVTSLFGHRLKNLTINGASLPQQKV